MVVLAGLMALISVSIREPAVVVAVLFGRQALIVLANLVREASPILAIGHVEDRDDTDTVDEASTFTRRTRRRGRPETIAAPDVESFARGADGDGSRVPASRNQSADGVEAVRGSVDDGDGIPRSVRAEQ